jgi:hypothetical protein
VVGRFEEAAMSEAARVGGVVAGQAAGRTSLAMYLPWGDGSGRRLRGWAGWLRLPLRAPFTLGLLAVAWALFLPFAGDVEGTYAVDPEWVRPFAYSIPDLGDDPVRLGRTLLTAPYFNHDIVQLVYVSLLLVVCGVVFEVREGTRRTALLFYVGLLSGALGAGLLLHVLYPTITEAPLYANAWERTWSGASAGIFGVIGALAARARRPWLLLALVVGWDLHWPYLRVWLSGAETPAFDLVWWHLPHAFSSAFHLPALAVGFGLGRWVVRREA